MPAFVPAEILLSIPSNVSSSVFIVSSSSCRSIIPVAATPIIPLENPVEPVAAETP
jgi:hypothetical protein